MHIKYTLFTILLFTCSLFCHAQSTGLAPSFKIVYEDFTLHVDAKGNISFSGKAEGNYDYWTNMDGSYRQGKIKTLANVPFDYYDSFSYNSIVGKLKSVGNVAITYYDQFSKHTGRLKSIGNINISYYDRFDDDNKTGKLKTVGNTAIDYYDRFSQSEKRGKIKSIKGQTPRVYFDVYSEAL